MRELRSIGERVTRDKEWENGGVGSGHMYTAHTAKVATSSVLY